MGPTYSMQLEIADISLKLISFFPNGCTQSSLLSKYYK